jgi:hypothetical protein
MLDACLSLRQLKQAMVMNAQITRPFGKSIYTLVFGGLLFVGLLFASACTAAPSYISESGSTYQWRLAANAYSNHCSDQITPLKNEKPLCRSVPIVTVPIQ